MDDLQGMLLRVIAQLDISSGCTGGLQARWRLIKARLEQLGEYMAASTETSSACAQMLHSSVLDTLRCIQDARSCSLISQGKLQAQSHLDTLVARIDAHTRDMKAVKNCSSSSSVGDLLSSLGLSSISSEIKASSLARLVRILDDDNGDAVAAAAAQFGAVPMLCRMLTGTARSSPQGLPEDAAHAMWKLAASPSSSKVSWDCAVLPLVKLAENGSPCGRLKALLTIQAVTSKISSSSNVVSILMSRPFLAKICFSASNSPEIQQTAAGIFKNLATILSLREALIEQSAIPALLHVYDSAASTPFAREDAAIALSMLSPPARTPPRSPDAQQAPQNKRRLVWALIVHGSSNKRKKKKQAPRKSLLLKKASMAKLVLGRKLLSLLATKLQ